MEALEVIRLVAPEFDEVSDADIERWIELAKPFVSKDIFENFYEQAIAYLVCHKMKLAGVGESVAGGGLASLSMNIGYSIGSISTGSESISFSNGGTSTERDSEYLKTQYGLQYLQIRRLVVVPITINH